MKVSHRKIMMAYGTILRMGDVRRAPATQLKFFKLKKALQDGFDFFCEEEKRTAEDMGIPIAENGMFLYPDDEKKKEFLKRRQELEELETDVELPERMIIRAAELKEISLNEMDALEAFVDFRE